MKEKSNMKWHTEEEPKWKEKEEGDKEDHHREEVYLTPTDTFKEVRPTSLFVSLQRNNRTPNKELHPGFCKPRGDPSGLDISLNYYTPLSAFFFLSFSLRSLRGSSDGGVRGYRTSATLSLPLRHVCECSAQRSRCHVCISARVKTLPRLLRLRPAIPASHDGKISPAPKPARREVGVERGSERKSDRVREQERRRERERGKPQCTLPLPDLTNPPTCTPPSQKTLVILPKGQVQRCSQSSNNKNAENEIKGFSLKTGGARELWEMNLVN